MEIEESEAKARAYRSHLEALTNRIISGSATIIAIIALATAIYQSKLMRDQAKVSVWPYLLVGNSGNNGYSRIVQNVGLGPAIIRSFQVTVNGKPVHSWKEAADSMHVQIGFKGSASTTFGQGIVVPTNALIDLLTLPDSSDVRAFRSHVSTLQTSVCYCSLYGDCWATSRDSYEPHLVRSCHPDPSLEFAR
jgi:hypothetical protein